MKQTKVMTAQEYAQKKCISLCGTLQYRRTIIHEKYTSIQSIHINE